MPDIEHLYGAERDALVSTAALILRDRALAEDVVQECFERYTSRPRDEVRRPEAYIRRMVVHDCYALARRRQREVYAEPGTDASYSDPALAEFDWALARLTPRRRTAIVLRYYCDLPVNEIALLMQARPSTVSSLLRRALHDLREVLDD